MGMSAGDLDKEMGTAEFRYSWRKMGGGSTRQSWIETRGLWPMFHWQRKSISQDKSIAMLREITVIFLLPKRKDFSNIVSSRTFQGQFVIIK